MKPNGALTPMLLQAAQERFDPYAERILDAARAQLLEYGLRRTSLNDIARAAGVARATLFRRFPNRDALLLALAVRETRRGIADVDAVISAIDDPEERIVAGFVVAADRLTNDELLQRLLVTDPERVLPLLARDDTILSIGREYVGSQVRRVRDDGAELAGDPDQIGELLARMALSLAANPKTVLPLDDDEHAARFARTMLVPLVISRPRGGA